MEWWSANHYRGAVHFDVLTIPMPSLAFIFPLHHPQYWGYLSGSHPWGVGPPSAQAMWWLGGGAKQHKWIRRPTCDHQKCPFDIWSATIWYHLEKHAMIQPDMVSKVLRSTYVDDIVTGAKQHKWIRRPTCGPLWEVLRHLSEQKVLGRSGMLKLINL